jgi:hypothetical protein
MSDKRRPGEISRYRAARRFHEPKFNKFPSVGCTCRSVEEREGSPPCRQPARIAEILPSELVCLPHESHLSSYSYSQDSIFL